MTEQYFRGKPERTAEGHNGGAQATETERHLRAEVELLRQRLQAVLSGTQSGTYTWAPQSGEFVDVDGPMLAMLGFPPEHHLTAADFLSRVHPEDRPAVTAAMAGQSTNADIGLEFRVTLPDGSLHWFYDRGIMQTRDHVPAYLVGAITDITETKRARDALIRTEKLAALGRLAATVAHEINNPLESVTNLIYLARTDPSVSNMTLEYLRMAEEELSRIASLTKQTLDFYREPAGVMRTQAGAILRQLLPVFGPRLSSKQIAADLKVRSDPEISAVPGELRQLFTNLISNSIDAVEQAGKISVRVSTARNRAGKPAVRVSIGDSGPGIPLSLREKIFEPFFTTKKEVGTGLGLWVSKSIVEKHGGAIRIRSNVVPGKSWTVISVLLPIDSEKETLVTTPALKAAV